MPPPAGERLPTLAELGFEPTDLGTLPLPTGMSGAARLFEDFLDRIDDYATARDYPAVKGPSYLSTHLRFGTMSIRQLVGHAQARGGRGAETWLSELIWREFYQMLLWHHPRVVGHAFKPAFDAIAWEDAPERFAAWCAGRTGYPLVDAAMRQLNQTGYMHNRLRMVAASFLTKDLGIDWRRGEACFAERLNRLRSRRQQRRLAVGGLHRLRCPALVPHLQSGDAIGEVRSAREVHSPLRAGTGARAGPVHPCALAPAGCRAGGAGDDHRAGLSAAGGRPRGGTATDAGALRPDQEPCLT